MATGVFVCLSVCVHVSLDGSVCQCFSVCLCQCNHTVSESVCVRMCMQGPSNWCVLSLPINPCRQHLSGEGFLRGHPEAFSGCPGGFWKPCTGTNLVCASWKQSRGSQFLVEGPGG